MQSVTTNVRNHPTPALPQPRGVEDTAPYERQRNVGIRIVVNTCVNAANLHPPLGSPGRGAVAARSAVTEGLVQRGCGVITLPVNPRRAGVEARPYDVWGVGAQNHRCLLSGGRRTGDGAPYGARGNVYALQLHHPSSNERGVEDAAPYGVCDRVGFSVAVSFSLSHPLRSMPQSRLRYCP